MLLLLNQDLRFMFQPVMTLKQKNYHGGAPLKETDPNQSRAVPKVSTLHTLASKLHHWSQATDRMGAAHNQLVCDKFSVPAHCIVVRWLVVVDLLQSSGKRRFFSVGRNPEVNISHARPFVSQIFKLIVVTSEKILNNLNMLV